MACKECGDEIQGWITYHREGNNDFVAYCYACTNEDPANTTERKKKEKWTERVRCSAGLWDKKTWGLIWQCNQCWQRCRIEGGAPNQCLRYWGWGKSRGKKPNGIARGTRRGNPRINPWPIPHVSVLSVDRGKTSRKCPILWLPSKMRNG